MPLHYFGFNISHFIFVLEWNMRMWTLLRCFLPLFSPATRVHSTFSLFSHTVHHEASATYAFLILYFISSILHHIFIQCCCVLVIKITWNSLAHTHMRAQFFSPSPGHSTHRLHTTIRRDEEETRKFYYILNSLACKNWLRLTDAYRIRARVRFMRYVKRYNYVQMCTPILLCIL